MSRVAVRVAMAVHLLVGRVALLGAVRVVQKVVRMVLRVLAMETLLGAVLKAVQVAHLRMVQKVAMVGHRVAVRATLLGAALRVVRAAAAVVKVQAGL